MFYKIVSFTLDSVLMRGHHFTEEELEAEGGHGLLMFTAAKWFVSG